jgi:hypothetical protein
MCRVCLSFLALLIGCAIADAEVLELEGTVKAVDASARSITIERKTPKGTKTLELEVNKKAGDLSSVKVGDRITFSYDPDLEVVTKLGGDGDASSAIDGNPLCRIGCSVAADGTSSGFIEEVKKAGGDEERPANDRKQAGGGLWTITHRFPDRPSCELYQASLTGKGAAAAFMPRLKAIELQPSADVNGGWANLHSPYRLRLPATVVVDVEAVDRNAYLTLPLKTGPTNSEINVLSEDGFRTCDVSHLFVTFGKDQNTPPKKLRAYENDGVSLKAGCRYEVKPDPTMSLQEVWFTGVWSFLGPKKECKGIRVKQISITARFAPMLGVGMKQEGEAVTVEQVIPRSLAEAAGIKAGDHIVSVAGKPVSQWQRAMQLLAVTEMGETWEIEVERDGQKKTFAIKAEVP